jgi:hypothetical protein
VDLECFAKNVESKIKSFLQEGIETLALEFTHCKFCYKGHKSLSFKSKNTSKTIVSYVVIIINGNLVAEECRNKLIPDGEDGILF